jgi:hypothetical protein
VARASTRHVARKRETLDKLCIANPAIYRTDAVCPASERPRTRASVAGSGRQKHPPLWRISLNGVALGSGRA